MDRTWKAGDTCTIKPSRKHAVLKAKCARLWTVYDVTGDDALVHDGPAGMTDLSGPGWTCSARVPLDCLLPPGEAYPTVAAEAGAEVLRLRARIAELEEARRWRVTAEVSPREGQRVLGWRGGDFEVLTYAEEGLDHPYLWSTDNRCCVDAPDRWLPLPGVPHE
jgi:hypothetical protein